MTAFALKSLPRSREAYRACANRCPSTAGGLRKASRLGVFLNTYYGPYSILLCRRCAEEWAAIWRDAGGSDV
jgi:hypothetical protein